MDGVFFAAPRPMRDDNWCQVFGGGQGWSFSVQHNINVDTDPEHEFEVHFIHPFIGLLTGTLATKGGYHKDLIRLKADGFFRGEPVKIDVKIDPFGGQLGRGTCYLTAYVDRNQGGDLDMTDIVKFSHGLPISYLASSVTFVETPTE